MKIDINIFVTFLSNEEIQFDFWSKILYCHWLLKVIIILQVTEIYVLFFNAISDVIPLEYQPKDFMKIIILNFTYFTITYRLKTI